MRAPLRRSLACAALLALAGCASVPLYPQRPSGAAGQPVAEPAPSRVVVHVAVMPEGLTQALDDALPLKGDGTFQLAGARRYGWERTPVTFLFEAGHVRARGSLTLKAELPVLGVQTVPFDLELSGEPVISSDWHARLQSPQVDVRSRDLRVRAADAMGDVLARLQEQLRSRLEAFSYDLAPRVAEVWRRYAQPIELPVGEARGCVSLGISGIEAAPSVLAGGFEKDLALVVAPSITLPCNAPPVPDAPPPLSNVASLPTGPFTVTVPVAATYEELAKATSLAFTGGRLYLSKTQPGLYLSNPEVYAADDQIVLGLHLGGSVKKGFFSSDLDGNLYFTGHPQVVDNELRVPDLQPSVGSADFLVKLAAQVTGDQIRDQARAALKLDLGPRLAAVRAKFSGDRPFPGGCLRTDVARLEVSGIYPHAAYLRVYVTATARAGVHVPCPAAAAPAAPPVAAAP